MACPPRVFERSSIGSHLKTQGPIPVSKVGWIHGGWAGTGMFTYMYTPLKINMSPQKGPFQ